MDRDVTYVFVGKAEIPRLVGTSDILYVGKTEQPVKVRFDQETSTNNSPRNTQQTNIRMTHVLEAIGPENYRCYYSRGLEMEVSGVEQERFLDKLRTWDKQFYLKLTDKNFGEPLKVPVEKYLLVQYASEHLELPPLNNRL